MGILQKIHSLGEVHQKIIKESFILQDFRNHYLEVYLDDELQEDYTSKHFLYMIDGYLISIERIGDNSCINASSAKELKFIQLTATKSSYSYINKLYCYSDETNLLKTPLYQRYMFDEEVIYPTNSFEQIVMELCLKYNETFKLEMNTTNLNDDIILKLLDTYKGIHQEQFYFNLCLDKMDELSATFQDITKELNHQENKIENNTEIRDYKSLFDDISVLINKLKQG